MEGWAEGNGRIIGIGGTNCWDVFIFADSIMTLSFNELCMLTPLTPLAFDTSIELSGFFSGFFTNFSCIFCIFLSSSRIYSMLKKISLCLLTSSDFFLSSASF
jgi:hypothetical protein